MATTAQRDHLHRLMRILIFAEPRVHYAQRRPMRTATIHTEAQLVAALDSPAGLTMDCSEAVTLLCRLAGLRDPNGLGYNGAGNTGTMLAHLPHYSKPGNALTGALVVFGPGTPQVRGDHVCMVYAPDAERGNPHLWSHGQERGPLDVTLATERKYHRPPVVFLSIAHL